MRLRRMFALTFFPLLLSAYTVGWAAEQAAAPVQLPPWVTPELLKATQAINMTPEQNPKFQQIVGDYVTAHFAMIQKESKRGAPNLDMTIRSKDKSLMHKMDEDVAGVLTKEQMPAYENYKKVLHAGLSP